MLGTHPGLPHILVDSFTFVLVYLCEWTYTEPWAVEPKIALHINNVPCSASALGLGLQHLATVTGHWCKQRRTLE